MQIGSCSQSVPLNNNMDNRTAGNAPLLWRLADIPFHDIRHSIVRHDQALFFILASSSLVKSGTDVYTRLLGEHFVEDSELVQWLDSCWYQQELQRCPGPGHSSYADKDGGKNGHQAVGFTGCRPDLSGAAGFKGYPDIAQKTLTPENRPIDS